MQKVFTIKLRREEFDLLLKASKKIFNPEEHRKNFGVGSFLKEVGIAKAKRILKKGNQ